MRQILIILSIFLLSSPVIGDNHKVVTLYRWGEYPDYVWKIIGDKEIQPKYQGEVENGKPNGLGLMIYPNGRKYGGEWKNGEMHGQGTYTWSDGGKYVGKFKDGRKNGQGTTIYPDGSKYIGEFKEGLPNGQGIDIFPDGSKGIGEFREGRPWNITHRDKNGNIIVKFVNGKEIKP